MKDSDGNQVASNQGHSQSHQVKGAPSVKDEKEFTEKVKEEIKNCKHIHYSFYSYFKNGRC